MAPVHNVSHIPVHSPLSEVCLPYSCEIAHRLAGRALRAGTGPLRRVVQEATRPQRGRRLPPSTIESDLSLDLTIPLFHMAVGYHGYDCNDYKMWLVHFSQPTSVD